MLLLSQPISTVSVSSDFLIIKASMDFEIRNEYTRIHVRLQSVDNQDFSSG